MEMIKSKTFWTGVITGVVSIAGSFGLPLPDELLPGLLGLMGIFLRMGLAKK